MRSRNHLHCLTRLLAAIAACVLVLGLPRLLVACTTSSGDVHVEFAHAEDACCDHAHGARGHDRSPRGDQPAAESGDACSHAELAVELAPTPRGEKPVFAPPPPLGTVVLPRFAANERTHRRPHAPSTGPPRRDAHTRLRTTSLLRC